MQTKPRTWKAWALIGQSDKRPNSEIFFSLTDAARWDHACTGLIEIEIKEVLPRHEYVKTFRRVRKKIK